MADWVHCNKCFVQYNTPQTSFSIVECGHLLCQRCVDNMKISKKCLICNKKSNVIPLNKNLEQNVLQFFLPVEDLWKRGIEVYKFQLQHRTTLYQNLQQRYQHVKKEYMTCYNTNKHLMKEIKMLRTGGRSPQGFITSTPLSQYSEANVTFKNNQNTSILSSIPPQVGVTPSKDKSMVRMYPGHPRRNHIFSSGSSQGPSPAQRVSLGYPKPQETPMIHRGFMGTMRPLEELRRRSQQLPSNNRN